MSNISLNLTFCSDSDRDISISQAHLEKKKQEIDEAANQLSEMVKDLDVKLNRVLKRQEQ